MHENITVKNYRTAIYVDSYARQATSTCICMHNEDRKQRFLNVLNKFIKLIPRQADISGINNPLPKAEIPRNE